MTNHWLWKFSTGPKETWILFVFTLPPNSGAFPNVMQNLLASEKRIFEPLSNSPFLLFSPGKRLLMLSLVQAWLNSRNVTAHVLDASVCGASSCSPNSIGLFGLLLSTVTFALFFYHLFPSTQFFFINKASDKTQSWNIQLINHCQGYFCSCRPVGEEKHRSGF